MAAEAGESGTASEIRNTQPSLAMSFLELAASMHMHHLVQEFLVHSPRGLDVCEPPLLVRLFAATISDVVLHRQLRSYPLAIELLEALPGLVPSTVQEEPSLLSQLIVDMKTQYAVYQLYSMEDGTDNMADFDSLLTRFFGCVPTWGDDKLQESIADLHEAAMLRLKGLAASPEKKACYWQDYVLSEVQMQAVWESVEKGVTALLAKVEASLPKPLLVQAFDLVRKREPSEHKQGSSRAQLKARIKTQDVSVLCGRLPEAVVASKLKVLCQRHRTTDAEQDTTTSHDECASIAHSDKKDQKVKELEAKLLQDLCNQTTSSSDELQMLYKEAQSSAVSHSPSHKRSRRISDSSDTSSTAIPEQQDGGMRKNISESPLKSPTDQAADNAGSFTCVVDSEEEGKTNTEVVDAFQKSNEMDTVANVCEVFEIP